jgi:hypothetical protein
MATDVTGRQLMPGQRIAYPVRKGSDMWLCTARIEYLSEGVGGTVIHARNPEGRPVKIVQLERVVILPENTPR